MRKGKIKFIFNREAKREMGLLLPGEPQTEMQNLLEFIICWNKAASGNKLLWLMEPVTQNLGFQPSPCQDNPQRSTELPN